MPPITTPSETLLPLPSPHSQATSRGTAATKTEAHDSIKQIKIKSSCFIYSAGTQLQPTIVAERSLLLAICKCKATENGKRRGMEGMQRNMRNLFKGDGCAFVKAHTNPGFVVPLVESIVSRRPQCKGLTFHWWPLFQPIIWSYQRFIIQRVRNCRTRFSHDGICQRNPLCKCKSMLKLTDVHRA